MESFDLKIFMQKMPVSERKRLAQEAGTTYEYLNVHVMRGRRIPKKKLMENLYIACSKREKTLTKERFLSFFYR